MQTGNLTMYAVYFNGECAGIFQTEDDAIEWASENFSFSYVQKVFIPTVEIAE